MLYLRAELASLKAVELINHEAIATLASERAANAILTDELESSLKKGSEMEDLIKALQIFLKYTNPRNPTHCEHDIMYVAQGVKPEDMSMADSAEVERLSFSYDEESGAWTSYRFGSS